MQSEHPRALSRPLGCSAGVWKLRRERLGRVRAVVRIKLGQIVRRQLALDPLHLGCDAKGLFRNGFCVASFGGLSHDLPRPEPRRGFRSRRVSRSSVRWRRGSKGNHLRMWWRARGGADIRYAPFLTSGNASREGFRWARSGLRRGQDRLRAEKCRGRDRCRVEGCRPGLGCMPCGLGKPPSAWGSVRVGAVVLWCFGSVVAFRAGRKSPGLSHEVRGQ